MHVIVFVLPGCGACEEFWPRAERIAGEYGVPIQRLALVNPQVEALANRLRVNATPAMVLFDGKRPVAKIEGAWPDGTIIGMMQHASQT